VVTRETSGMDWPLDRELHLGRQSGVPEEQA